MIIKQDLLNSNRYSLKCPYFMEPWGICVHNTANNAPAKNEISYMKNNDSSTSFHIAVDNKEAIQAIPFNRNAFHAGDGGNGNGNRHYIGIEICYSTGNLNTFLEAEKNAVKVIVQILKQYNWGIDKVKKHQDFSGKYCPHKTLDLGWTRFINMIRDELDGLNAPSNPNTSGELYRVRKSWNNVASQLGAFKELNNAKSACKDGYKVFNNNGEQVYPVYDNSNTSDYKIGHIVSIKSSATHYATGQPIANTYKNKNYTILQVANDKVLIKELYSWVWKRDLSGATVDKPVDKPINKPVYKEYAENGTAKVIVSKLNVRDNPNGNIVAYYTNGETFTYNYVRMIGNQVWVRYTSYTGKTRWVCVKENGSRYANCY